MMSVYKTMSALCVIIAGVGTSGYSARNGMLGVSAYEPAIESVGENLINAASSTNPEAITALLAPLSAEQQWEAISYADHEGLTALIWTSAFGDAQGTTALLALLTPAQQQTLISHVDSHGETALIYAIRLLGDDPRALIILIEHGAFHYASTDQLERLALQMAAKEAPVQASIRTLINTVLTSQLMRDRVFNRRAPAVAAWDRDTRAVAARGRTRRALRAAARDGAATEDAEKACHRYDIVDDRFTG